MTLDNIIDQQLNALGEKDTKHELRKYLKAKYRVDPFPYQFTEQDLYENVRKDIRDYKAGKLDITASARPIDCKDELEELQKSYVERLGEIHELTNYIGELERILSEHNLESPRAAKLRLEWESGQIPF